MSTRRTLDEKYDGYLRNRVKSMKSEELAAIRDSVKRSPHFRYLEDEAAEMLHTFGRQQGLNVARW